MIRKILALSIVALSLAGCAGNGAPVFGSTGPKAIMGALLGGAGGGWVGSQICNGNCGKATTAAGALLGLAAGYGIGDSLDNIDRMKAEQATQYAVAQAPIGQQINWDNPNTGNYGSTTTLRRGTTNTGASCSQYSQTINVQGRAQTATGVACQRGDGTWAIQPNQSANAY